MNKHITRITLALALTLPTIASAQTPPINHTLPSAPAPLPTVPPRVDVQLHGNTSGPTGATVTVNTPGGQRIGGGYNGGTWTIGGSLPL